MSDHAEIHPVTYRSDPWSVGPWLGWLTLIAVGVAVGTDRAGPHPSRIIVLAVLGAAANAAAQFLPHQHRAVDSSVRRVLLDAWCAGVLAFGAALVIIGGSGSDFDWVFVLSIPFIALAQRGNRRIVWLVVGLLVFLVALLLRGEAYPASGVAFRMVVISAAAVLVIRMSQAVTQEAEARSEAATRAQLERLLVAEAHHRVKNSLQLVADLLLLSRPDDASGRAFDETAARIQSIGAVHTILQSTEGTDAPGDAVVRQVVAGIDPAITVTTEPVRVSAAVAQHLGVVTNELVANAVQHGQPPVSVALTIGAQIQLDVIDHGPGYDPSHARLGLLLVRQVVSQGLHGTLTVEANENGGTRTRVVFPFATEAPR